MKKVILLLITLSVLVLTGCAEKDNLMGVLENERTFMAENGQEVYLSEYMYVEDSLATLTKYSCVDLNGDGNDEVVVCISEWDDWFLVLHEEEDQVYGYCFYIRSLNDIKADGSFTQSGGAALTAYCQLQFEDGTYQIRELAYKDDMEGVYRLNGENCSVQEVDDFISERNQMEAVTWVDMEQSDL